MIEQSMKGFGRLPDPIINAPDLWPWLQGYYTAFEELSSDRRVDSMSGDIGYIPWTSIDRYCERHRDGIGRDFDLALLYIRTLDFRYRKLVREARPADKRPGKPASAGPQPVRRPPKRYRKK